MVIIYLLTYIIAIFISLLLAFFLFTANKKSKAISFLAYTGLTVGVWFAVEFIVKFFGFNEFYELFAWKTIPILRYIGVFLFTLFILEFTKKTLPKFLSVIFILLGVFFSAIILTTNKVYESITSSMWGGYDHVLGEWAYYILPTIAFSMLIPGYFLLRYFLELKKGSSIRRQISYLFAGSTFIFVAAFVDDIGLPLIGVTSLNITHIAVSIFEIFIFYIIYKHEAFEIGILKLRIRHKILFGLLVSATAPLLVVYFTNFQPYQETLTNSVLEKAKVEIEAHATELNTRFGRYDNDIAFIAASTVLCNCLDEENSVGHEELEDFFAHFMESSNVYMQIRYIDEFGDEVVRVDSIDGVTVRVPKEDLQNKSDRYYFSETMILNKGEVFVSSIDLNREGSPPEIEIPYNSVIRYAMPVFDSKGNRRGIIITNIFANDFLVGYQVHEEHLDFLIDNEGYYLSHNKNPSKNWGGSADLNTGENIKVDFPEVADQFLAGGSDNVVYKGDVFSYFTIYPTNDNKDYYLIAVELNPHESIFAPIDRLKYITYISLLVAALVVLMIGYYIARTISSPINELHKSIEAVRHGDLKQKIIAHSQDEIGDLARAYMDMLFAVKESRKDIEKKVEEQTKDINRQKEEISIERDKLDTTLKSIGDGVFVVDIDHKIILFNTAMEKISGYKAEEVLDVVCHDVLKFVLEGTDEEAGTCISDALKEGEVQMMEKNSELIKKDGRRVAVADSAAPIKDGKGKTVGAVIVIRDATKERAIDRAKGEFVSTVSHQLRTPLVGIRWVIEMFTKEEKLTKKGKEYLGDIERSMERLAELVDALLNVSRLEGTGGVSITPKPLDLISYVEGFMSENRPLLAKKNLKFIFENKPNELNIETDKSALGNILQSLVANALEYTLENGEIEISIEEKEVGDTKRFVLSLRDTGIGIPKEEQKTIFDKFSRGSNAKLIKTDGTGLGLFIAKQSAGLLGGTIWFESEKDKGTTFFVELPIKSPEIKGEKPLT